MARRTATCSWCAAARAALDKWASIRSSLARLRNRARPIMPTPPRVIAAPAAERFESHTRHCESCRAVRDRAIAGADAARLAAVVGGFAAAFWLGVAGSGADAPGLGGSSLNAGAAVLPLAFYGLSRALEALADATEQGPDVPPRNRA